MWPNRNPLTGQECFNLLESDQGSQTMCVLHVRKFPYISLTHLLCVDKVVRGFLFTSTFSLWFLTKSRHLSIQFMYKIYCKFKCLWHTYLCDGVMAMPQSWQTLCSLLYHFTQKHSKQMRRDLNGGLNYQRAAGPIFNPTFRLNSWDLRRKRQCIFYWKSRMPAMIGLLTMNKSSCSSRLVHSNKCNQEQRWILLGWSLIRLYIHRIYIGLIFDTSDFTRGACILKNAEGKKTGPYGYIAEWNRACNCRRRTAACGSLMLNGKYSQQIFWHCREA